jgi:hypothetical protein
VPNQVPINRKQQSVSRRVCFAKTYASLSFARRSGRERSKKSVSRRRSSMMSKTLRGCPEFPKIEIREILGSVRSHPSPSVANLAAMDDRDAEVG